MFHYVRLESYDDTFHNIAFEQQPNQLAFELNDYFLTYMLPHETQNSPALLNVRQLDKPFDYKLNVAKDGELHPTAVDLVTTFNFLIGLRVQTLRRFLRGKRPIVRVTGVNRAGERLCILWRDVPTTPKQLDSERDWLLKNVLHDVEYDRFLVNGETTLPNAEILDAEFKRLMTPGAN